MTVAELIDYLTREVPNATQQARGVGQEPDIIVQREDRSSERISVRSADADQRVEIAYQELHGGGPHDRHDPRFRHIYEALSRLTPPLPVVGGDRNSIVVESGEAEPQRLRIAVWRP
jgi:hypothetical protein